MITREFKISGMTCGHCVKAVDFELSKISIEQKEVQIGSAKVTYDENKVNEAAIKQAVEEAGYKVI